MSVILESIGNQPSRCGVGFSQALNAEVAVAEAVTAALGTLCNRDADAVLVFATAGYDQQSVVADVTARLPVGVPVVGCSAEGVICHGYSFEQANALVVVAFSSSKLRFVSVHVEGLSGNEAQCGQALANQVAALPDAQVLLLFPDGLTGNISKVLTPLDEGCPELTIVGGAAGDMLSFEKTFQYADGRAMSNAVSGLVICGPVEVTTEVNHGCHPVGRELTVTESDGRLVRRIDGRPAWEVMQDYVGERDHLSPMDIAHLALGRRTDANDHAECSTYAVRMPLAVDADTGGVVFPGGLDEGDVVRLMRRDPERVSDGVVRAAVALRARAREPFVVLQLDCAGRGVMLFGEETTASIAAPVQGAFDNCPVVGLHTYGELGQLGGATQFHNYTVALIALSEGT